MALTEAQRENVCHDDDDTNQKRYMEATSRLPEVREPTCPNDVLCSFWSCVHVHIDALDLLPTTVHRPCIDLGVQDTRAKKSF